MIEAALLAQALAQGRLHKALAAGLVAERGELANARERARGLAAARSKWLSDRDAERSFPCGVVRPNGLVDESVRDVRPELAVIAAILPATVTFLVEPPPMYPSEEPIEVGSIDRASIGAVEVVTLEDQPVWRPATEPLDPEPEVLLSITWTDEAGEPPSSVCCSAPPGRRGPRLTVSARPSCDRSSPDVTFRTTPVIPRS